MHACHVSLCHFRQILKEQKYDKNKNLSPPDKSYYYLKHLFLIMSHKSILGLEALLSNILSTMGSLKKL